MKSVIIFLVTITSVTIAFSQLPQKISYQAIIRNGNGELVKDSTIGIRISILKDTDTGIIVYAETHSKTTNENGLLTLEIGNGSPEVGGFSEIDWSIGNYFLKSEIDFTGGTNYSITGTSQLLSVPYALYAGKAEGAAGIEDLDKLEKSMNDGLNALEQKMTEKLAALQQSMSENAEKLENRLKSMEKLFYSQLTVPSDGLNAFFPFNGNAIDFSGNGWDGTVNNGELITDRFGNADNAYYFSGNANILTQFPGVTGNGDRSISFWALTTSEDVGGSCFFYGSSSNGAFFNVSVFAQPEPHVHLDIGNAYADYLILNNYKEEWHHYVVVFSTMFGTSSDGIKVYFDGERISDYTGDNPSTYPVNTGTSAKFTIGGKPGIPAQLSIDDFRFYDRILEESEIRQLFYESGKYNGQQTINDSDGNSYAVLKIGDQLWMAENLRTTRYSDGTKIPLITDYTEWINLTSPAYCWQNNDIGNKPVYGALYTWHTVETEKLCPSGWYVPTDAEWTILENNLGGAAVAGGKLKESGNVHWLDPNLDASNESGFTALPGGWRDGVTGAFTTIGVAGMWWTSQETSPGRPYWREIYYSSGTIFHQVNGDPSFGLSVRCVKD